jgi:hypothetical protein
MGHPKLAVVIAGTALLGAALRPALARPPHKKALADYLGIGVANKLNDCRTCHVPLADGEDPDLERPHNAFGKRLKAVRLDLKQAGKPSGIPARLDAVGDEDSDGDGVANLLELVTGHFPGDAADRPVEAELARGRAAVAAIKRSHVGYAWHPFERVSRPTPPQVRARSRLRNPIDDFIAAEQESRSLAPRPEASRPVLLRRLYLDLTGLPPKPDELDAFLSDSAPDAYEKVVDRLLGSPAHGERWGRHWMDIWRYSDWAGWGQQVRDSQPHIWHWRDWIVESLNRDQPYDRMVVAMLAADEAYPDDPDAIRATGYLARNFKLLSREKWMQDVVDHTSQAFLGVTLGCARCHDHMYDPILQQDYYRVRAIFEPHQVRIDRVPGVLNTATDGIPRAFDAQLEAKTLLFVRGDDRTPTGNPLPPGVPELLSVAFAEPRPVPLPHTAVVPDRRAFVIRDQIAADQAAVAQAQKTLASMTKSIKYDEGIEKSRLELDFAMCQLAARLAVERAGTLAAQGRKGSKEWNDAAVAAAGAQRDLAIATTRRDEAGARRARRAAPPGQRADADQTHAKAAQALIDAQKAASTPLTVNYKPPVADTYPSTSTGRRLAFARWIVDPSNPLAARVAVNHLWGRHFGRAIVPSVNEFGRNGQPPSHPALLDWLAAEFMARGWSMKAIHRLIVTSATYRQDSTPDPADLARDPDNVFLWRWSPRRAEAEVVRDCLFAVAGSLDSKLGGPDLDHAGGLTIPRRSLYFRHAAEKQMEFLQIFDGAGVTECYRRKESILPQQALALANSELSRQIARRVAHTLSQQVGSDPSAFVTAAFEQVLSRPPSELEKLECLRYMGNDPAARTRASMVHVLLNHHDFVTIR